MSTIPALTVLLDTNILVSAFLTPGGDAWEILRRVKGQRLVLSTAVLSEVEQVLVTRPRLRRTYTYTDEQVRQYCRNLLTVAVLLPVTTTLAVCRDPDDNAILACAVHGQAYYLITRNLDHFPSQHGKVAIISPQEALRVLPHMLWLRKA